MIAHLDCSTGVSGDKLLGAVLDAGTAIGAFTISDLESLVARIAPEARVRVERVLSHGIAAVGVSVSFADDPPARHLGEIIALIQKAALGPGVEDQATRAFTLLAEAEARVHGTTPDHVHFHEVGATDAIVDIVGVVAGMSALSIASLSATPVAVGSGMVSTSHGLLPVPAPATLALLEGVPVRSGPVETELTTPTGAVLLKTLAPDYGPCPPMTPRIAGHGAGTRDIGTPNVCRLLLGDPAEEATAPAAEQVTLLETNIDHLSPEAVAFSLDQLIAEGCLDAWVTPIVMKKGRPGMLLSVLVPKSEAQVRAGRIIDLTGTLGVRDVTIERFVAERESRTVETSYGTVRFKVGAGRIRPEHEDVARIARETGQTYTLVVRKLTALFEE